MPLTDDESGLVMPFVCVTSVGGPYDDDAFCAGYALGELSAKLEPRRIAATTMTIRSASVEQADLIAMRWGYRMDRLPSDDDPDTPYDDGEWAFVGFTREDSTDVE